MERGSTSAAEPKGQWGIRGREAEIAQLRRAIRSPGSGAILTGPVGIGLTTLLSMLAEEADPGTVDVVEIRGEPHTTESDLAAFAHAAPPGAVGAPRLADQMAAILASLRQQAGSRRTLLLVDDADWLDGASVAVACQLLESGAGSLVAAFHVPTAATAGLERLWRSGRLELIEPHALTLAEISDLVGHRLGGALAEPAAEQILAATLGRPGFVRPFVQDAVAAGALYRHIGVWVCGWHDFEMPRTARSARISLSEADEEVRRVVRYVSLARQLPMAVLNRLVGATAVIAAEDNGWISSDPSGRVQVDPPVFAAGIEQSLGVATARSLRADIVREWSALQPLDPADELQLVLLGRETDQPPTPAELGRAAHIAASRLQVGLAADLASGARTEGQTEFGALALAANARTMQSRPSGLVIDELTDRATSDAAKARVAYEQGVSLLWGEGDMPGARAVIRAALAETTDRAVAGALTGLLALTHALDSDYDEARRLIATVLAGPQTDSTVIAAGEAALAIKMATAAEVEGAPGVEEVEAALDRHPTMMTSVAGWFGQLGASCFVLGEAHELAGLIERWRARDLESVAPYGVALTSTLLGEYSLLRGRVRIASHHFIQALAVLEADGAAVWRERTAARLALSYAMMGEFGSARTLLAEQTGQVGDPGRITGLLSRVTAYWLTGGEGDPVKAAAMALSDAAEWRLIGATGHEIAALHQAVRFGDASAEPRLAELAASHEVTRAQIAAAAALALRNQNPVQLSAAADVAEAGGMDLAALDMQAQAAAMLRDRGDRAGYWAGMARARQLRRSSGTDTPSWLAVRRELPLTARESEVARLVALGLSNVEVARRLVISPRTAEGHLQRIFDKLGLHDRADLAAVLEMDPDTGTTDGR